jgi:hypothetical protein
MSVGGILIKELPLNVQVPDGATSWKKDQFCTSPGSVDYVSITFQTDGLLDALHKQLDALGYTKKLHAALRELQQHLEERTTQQELGEMINNKIVAVAKLVKLEINEDVKLEINEDVNEGHGAEQTGEVENEPVPTEWPSGVAGEVEKEPWPDIWCSGVAGEVETEPVPTEWFSGVAGEVETEPWPAIWPSGGADESWWQAEGTEPWSSGAASSNTEWFQ